MKLKVSWTTTGHPVCYVASSCLFQCSGLLDWTVLVTTKIRTAVYLWGDFKSTSRWCLYLGTHFASIQPQTDHRPGSPLLCFDSCLGPGPFLILSLYSPYLFVVLYYIVVQYSCSELCNITSRKCTIKDKNITEAQKSQAAASHNRRVYGASFESSLFFF